MAVGVRPAAAAPSPSFLQTRPPILHLPPTIAVGGLLPSRWVSFHGRRCSFRCGDGSSTKDGRVQRSSVGVREVKAWANEEVSLQGEGAERPCSYGTIRQRVCLLTPGHLAYPLAQIESPFEAAEAAVADLPSYTELTREHVEKVREESIRAERMKKTRPP